MFGMFYSLHKEGYSFNLSHTLSYSMIGLQEMNLAFNYPILFWNCANIIVDSMATDLITKDEDEIGYIEDSENYDDGNEDEEERSSSPVEYGKNSKSYWQDGFLWSNSSSSRYK